jgi:hypothetical protein
MVASALKEGANHEAPFERRLKPDAVKTGKENRLAIATHTIRITTPWRMQRQTAKKDMLWCEKKSLLPRLGKPEMCSGSLYL